MKASLQEYKFDFHPVGSYLDLDNDHSQAKQTKMSSAGVLNLDLRNKKNLDKGSS